MARLLENAWTAGRFARRLTSTATFVTKRLPRDVRRSRPGSRLRGTGLREEDESDFCYASGGLISPDEHGVDTVPITRLKGNAYITPVILLGEARNSVLHAFEDLWDGFVPRRRDGIRS